MQQKGFSLIELSIVLVVLGLLTGGILAGKSLIRASEIRSVGVQSQQLTTAAHAFRDKYLAIPGDMSNATSFWGSAAPGAACKTAASTTSLTCDGNGNGIINPPADLLNTNEIFRFWQHLANAGLIAGSYDGIAHDPSDSYGATTQNSPAGRIGNTLWFSYGWGTRTASTSFFDGNYDRSLEFGGAIANSEPTMPVLLPEELWNIDSKYDDGKPVTGKIRHRGWNVAANNTNLCTDATASNQLTASYAVSVTTPVCLPIFPNAY